VSGVADLKVKRMNINVEVNLHDRFKAATAAKGENMTDVLLRFIEEYVATHGVAPKKKQGRK
jgi:ParG